MNDLFDTQTDAQRMISRLANVYPLWQTGDVKSVRWDSLVDKFSTLYETDLSPSARQWRKKRGQCCTYLIGARLPGDMVRWVLLVTETGHGEVKLRERLRDIRSERLVWGDYVLITSTKPRTIGGGTHWTWCFTPAAERREANYLTKLAQAAASRGQSFQLKAYTDTLLQRPLHSGIRQQTAKMLRRAQKVWARHANGLSWPGPDPAVLPYFGAYRTRSPQLERSASRSNGPA